LITGLVLIKHSNPLISKN